MDHPVSLSFTRGGRKPAHDMCGEKQRQGVHRQYLQNTTSPCRTHLKSLQRRQAKAWSPRPWFRHQSSRYKKIDV
jgi:hypothetical protein